MSSNYGYSIALHEEDEGFVGLADSGCRAGNCAENDLQVCRPVACSVRGCHRCACGHRGHFIARSQRLPATVGMVVRE